MAERKVTMLEQLLKIIETDRNRVSDAFDAIANPPPPPPPVMSKPVSAKQPKTIERPASAKDMLVDEGMCVRERREI
jgi:hypothetical protein